MSRAFALLVAALALGGCFGQEPAAESETASTVAPTPEPEAEAAVEAAFAEPAAPVLVPVSHDGALANYLVACEFVTGVVGCQGTPASARAGVDLPHPGGNATAFSLEMSWTAASPATQTLGMHVFGCAESEDGGFTCEMYAAAEGASPLTLAATGLSIPEGQELRAFAFRPSELPPSPVPGFVYYEFDQAFHLEGTVTVQPVP